MCIYYFWCTLDHVINISSYFFFFFSTDGMLIWIGELEERMINTMATSLGPEETCVVKMRVFSEATRLILAITTGCASTTSSSISNIGTSRMYPSLRIQWFIGIESMVFTRTVSGVALVCVHVFLDLHRMWTNCTWTLDSHYIPLFYPPSSTFQM